MRNDTGADDPLAGLTELRDLDLADNRIADLAALARLGSLEVLLLDRNRVSDVVALTQLPGPGEPGPVGQPDR